MQTVKLLSSKKKGPAIAGPFWVERSFLLNKHHLTRRHEVAGLDAVQVHA